MKFGIVAAPSTGIAKLPLKIKTQELILQLKTEFMQDTCFHWMMDIVQQVV